MKSNTKVSSVGVKLRFPALYRFIVDGPDLGVVYLVVNGDNFDGICVDRANSRAEIGDHIRLGSPLSPERWARLAPESTVTLTQE